MMTSEDDGETVLAGAEAYHSMLDNCEAQLNESDRRIGSYRETHKHLSALLETSHRNVLAPIAGGLAYLPGRLVHTNDVLVLLGDNWFAHRSVKQACGIAERRIEFLQRERKVLEEEHKSLLEKREYFTSEFGTKEYEEVTGQRSGADSTQASQRPAQANVGRGEFQLPSEGVLGPDDDLTVDELEELEAELGEDVMDDAIVEKAMMEKMIEKHKRRVMAEAKAKQSRVLPSAAQQPQLPSPPPAVEPGKSKKSVKFADPGQIGLPHDDVVEERRAPPAGKAVNLPEVLIPASVQRESIVADVVRERVVAGKKEPDLSSVAPTKQAKKSVFMRQLGGDEE